MIDADSECLVAIVLCRIVLFSTTVISKLLLEGRLRKGTTVVIDVPAGATELSFQVVAPAQKNDLDLPDSNASSATPSPVFGQPFKKSRRNRGQSVDKADDDFMNE